MHNNRERAKRLMKHYLRMAADAADQRWDRDNDAEIDELVDCLIDAAKTELDLETRIERLEAITS